MTDDLLDRLARRSRLRRALGFAAIAAVIALSVLGRSVTEPAPRSALSAAGLAQPVGSTGASAAPGTSAAAHPRQHRRTPVKSPAPRRTPSTTPHPGTTRSATPHPSATRRPSTTTTTTTHATVSVRRTITGAAYDVSYGTVQVRVTFNGSTITDVTAVSLPQGGRSSDISAMAAPQLRREALAAQSSNIDAVSGASYTSAGYARSLQSAIDQSHG